MTVVSHETEYGFQYGAASVSRACSDQKKGWVVIEINTPRDDLQIYVTKTGKVRVHRNGRELLQERKR